MTKWDPAKEPFRIRRIFVTAARGCHGWRDTVETVETEAEAIAAVAAPMPRGCIEVQADEYLGDRWNRLSKRRRKGY